MKPAGSPPKGRRLHQMHGLYSMKHALTRLGNRAIDGRSKPGRALAKWRVDLVRDLGGEISTQQSALVDLAVKSKLILDSIDTWLLNQPSLINVRKRSLIPVVKERQQLADGLARYLAQLGLERIPPPQKSLEQYVEEKYGSHADDGGDDEP
jgi:hypothetical protein